MRSYTIYTLVWDYWLRTRVSFVPVAEEHCGASPTTDERQSRKTVFRVIPERVVIWHFRTHCGVRRTPIRVFSVDKKINRATGSTRKRKRRVRINNLQDGKNFNSQYIIIILMIIIFIYRPWWFRSGALQNNIILFRGFIYIQNITSHLKRSNNQSWRHGPSCKKFPKL